MNPEVKTTSSGLEPDLVLPALENDPRLATSLPDRFPTLSERDFLAAYARPVQLLIPGLIEAGSLTLFSAPPNNGKTGLLFLCGITVATGKQVAGTFTGKQGKVLFAGFEASGYQYAKHHERLRKGLGLKEIGIDFQIGPGLDLMSKDGWDYFEETVRKGGYDLVLIDGLKAASTAEENSNTEMDKLMTRLLSLTVGGRSVIVSHHMAKPKQDDRDSDGLGASRGASCITARCDAVWHLTLNQQTRAWSLRCRKSRGAIPDRLEHQLRYDWDDSAIRVTNGGSVLGEFLCSALANAGADGLKRGKLIELAASFKLTGETDDTFGQRVDRELAPLKDSGRVRHDGQGKSYIWVH